MLARLWGDEAGATAIEYGLLVALIAIISLGALQSMGLTLTEVFETIIAAIRLNLD